MAILVTGGTGYIGSHTTVELLQAGYEVVIIDNYTNSKPEVHKRISSISGKEFKFYEVDINDKVKLEKVFQENVIDAVIHFAGLKAVGESVKQPLYYYQNNLVGTLNLLEAMQNHGVYNMVFSSSATVYGIPKIVPIEENFPLQVTNPYGRTKLMIEEILIDTHVSNPKWRVTLLHYFNPIGAHESGMIGEDPTGTPNNLMPYITQVAVGKLDRLSVFGGDYSTVDGTGVRDYIHVVDLAKGHLKALNKVMMSEGVEAYNLGTGKGYSVLQMIHAFEKASGRNIPYQIVDRRPGDIAECYANPEKAKKELGWQAEKSLEEMCADSWRWQEKNPNGYGEEKLCQVMSADIL